METQETTVFELERQKQILLDHSSELGKENRELKSLVQGKNSLIIKLEAENVRLRMQRTDKELATQAEGLRAEIGKKDRQLVELKKVIETYKDNEVIILRRASAAEQKVATVQNTLVTMQRARDAAQLEAEKHDRARLDAVRDLVAISDSKRVLQERVTEIVKENEELKKKQQQKR